MAYASATLLTIFGSGYIFDEVGVTDDIIKGTSNNYQLIHL